MAAAAAAGVGRAFGGGRAGPAGGSSRFAPPAADPDNTTGLLRAHKENLPAHVLPRLAPAAAAGAAAALAPAARASEAGSSLRAGLAPGSPLATHADPFEGEGTGHRSALAVGAGAGIAWVSSLWAGRHGALVVGKDRAPQASHGRAGCGVQPVSSRCCSPPLPLSHKVEIARSPGACHPVSPGPLHVASYTRGLPAGVPAVLDSPAGLAAAAAAGGAALAQASPNGSPDSVSLCLHSTM